ncbi:MAG: agmatinase family protein [Acidobacteriota bacterium]|nr:agmatinase family protein [Acidobacteriota bacterium]
MSRRLAIILSATVLACTPSGPETASTGGAILEPREEPEASTRDNAVIELQGTEEELDLWKLRDASGDPAREPGLIDLSRFQGRSAIPTFFGVPAAITPLDLVAGEVEVAIMGAAIDMGVGMRGAGEGPRAFRAASDSLGAVLPHMHVMVSWGQELTVADYGDAPIDNLSTERSVGPVRRMVREIAEAGAIPIIIGGDHSLEYPNVAGVTDVYGKGNVGVVHFDAHYDAGDIRNGHLISHAQPVRRLVEEGHVRGDQYIQVGLRGYWPGEDGFNWMRENNLRYHTMVEIERDGWPPVVERVLNEANELAEHLYVSFDIDVLDPAYTPGTGTPEPGGLTTREIFPIVRTLCSENNLVGFDLVEFNPLVDPGYTTGLNAQRIVQECLTGIAMRKKGLDARHYLSPLTAGDGRRGE